MCYACYECSEGAAAVTHPRFHGDSKVLLGCKTVGSTCQILLSVSIRRCGVENFHTLYHSFSVLNHFSFYSLPLSIPLSQLIFPHPLPQCPCFSNAVLIYMPPYFCRVSCSLSCPTSIHSAQWHATLRVGPYGARCFARTSFHQGKTDQTERAR